VSIKVNKIDINVGAVGAAAIPAVGIYMIIFQPRTRPYSIAALTALAVLVIWNLWRGGTVAFPGFTLSGHPSAARPRASGGLAPSMPAARVAAPPFRSNMGALVVLGLLATGAAWFVVTGHAHQPATATTRTPGEPARPGPAAVVEAYFSAINQRDCGTCQVK
jgi:hypothetical protein